MNNLAPIPPARRRRAFFDPSPLPGLRQEDFRCVGSGGLGDGLNAYAHSMAWFNGRLFVGTTRGNFPLMKKRLPLQMKRWPVECPDDPFELDLRAQIWSYDPEAKHWEQVYRAPLIRDEEGKPIPRELGYRAMVEFQGRSDRKPALYVATWSPARGPGPIVLRSTDGRHFKQVAEPGLLDLPITTIRTLVPFKGKLFTAPTGTRGGNPNTSQVPVVYVSEDPAKGGWQAASTPGFGSPDNLTIFELAVLGSYLYAGTFNENGYEIWRTRAKGAPPYDWEQVIGLGAYRGSLNECVACMYAFEGALYVGSGIQNGGVDVQRGIGPGAAELIRIHPDRSWDLIVGTPRMTPRGMKTPISGTRAGFDNLFNGYFWCMGEHDGWLYLGTFDWSIMLHYANMDNWLKNFRFMVKHIGTERILENQGGFDLYRSRDGENWVPVSLQGFGNPYNYGVRNFVSTPYGLFVGTANPFGPRILDAQANDYVENPRGGLEVWLGTRS